MRLTQLPSHNPEPVVETTATAVTAAPEEKLSIEDLLYLSALEQMKKSRPDLYNKITRWD